MAAIFSSHQLDRQNRSTLNNARNTSAYVTGGGERERRAARAAEKKKRYNFYPPTRISLAARTRYTRDTRTLIVTRYYALYMTRDHACTFSEVHSIIPDNVKKKKKKEIHVEPR